MEAAIQQPPPARTPPRSSKRKERTPKSAQSDPAVVAARSGYLHHVTPFGGGGGGAVPEPCTPQARRWILLCLASALAFNAAFYFALVSTGSHGRAAEVAANLGGVLCFPTALSLFFVLMDLCNEESPPSSAQPLLEDGDRIEVRLEEGEREKERHHVKAIGVDNLRRLAVANQLKASI